MCFSNPKVGYIRPRVFDSGTLVHSVSPWLFGFSVVGVRMVWLPLSSMDLLETVFEMFRDLLIGDG